MRADGASVFSLLPILFTKAGSVELAGVVVGPLSTPFKVHLFEHV